MSKKIKRPQKNNSKFTITESPNYDDMPIIFSLEKINGDEYCFSRLDDKDKIKFAESIYKRRNITWKEIYSLNRHDLGCEKIPISQINKKPKNITDDLKSFLVFRYNGKKAMIGFRKKNIFYVIWFDHDFTLYKH